MTEREGVQEKDGGVRRERERGEGGEESAGEARWDEMRRGEAMRKRGGGGRETGRKGRVVAGGAMRRVATREKRGRLKKIQYFKFT